MIFKDTGGGVESNQLVGKTLGEVSNTFARVFLKLFKVG